MIAEAQALTTTLSSAVSDKNQLHDKLGNIIINIITINILLIIIIVLFVWWNPRR